MSQKLMDTATNHAFFILSIVDRTWNRITEAAFKTGYVPIARLSETAVVTYELALLHFTLRILLTVIPG